VKNPGEVFVNILKPLFCSPKISKGTVWTQTLLSIIEEQLGTSHNQYSEAFELIHRYEKTSNIEPFLRLYTLETPFYRYLTNSKDSSVGLGESRNFSSRVESSQVMLSYFRHFLFSAHFDTER